MRAEPTFRLIWHRMRLNFRPETSLRSDIGSRRRTIDAALRLFESARLGHRLLGVGCVGLRRASRSSFVDHDWVSRGGRHRRARVSGSSCAGFSRVRRPRGFDS